MALMNEADLQLAQAISNLTFCNQFLPERLELERAALGKEYVSTGRVWSNRIDNADSDANILKLQEKAEDLLKRLQTKLQDADEKPDQRERGLYIDVALYLMYYRYYQDLQELIGQCEAEPGNPKVTFYEKFEKDFNGFMDVLAEPRGDWLKAEHLLALYFQVRRAFYYIFNCILGGSMPTAMLRADAWQSIFTHDVRRYMRCLYRRIGDINTLIMGPSGTGKDLVARAIGMARYVPFDPKTRTFDESFVHSFHTLNISALSPTLVESELFGHVKGSFTGAHQDRAGHLEACTELGTIFLDEIGEIDPAIQVKLLRVLQDRTFQRLGDTRTREFSGKIIAATNKDLVGEMDDGSFRQDFYYRLCSDVIRTPSLHEQLQDSPEELHNLVFLLVKRIAGEDECEDITNEVVSWIERELGPDYRWPGNVRELEQCVRNIIVRQEYRPTAMPLDRDDSESLLRALREGDLTADDVVRLYCTLLYERLGNYQEVARRLELDRRTVKGKLDANILHRFSGCL